MNNIDKHQLEAERLFLQRRRWTRVGVTYVLMLSFMMIFLSERSLFSRFSPHNRADGPSLGSSLMFPDVP